MPKTPSRRCDGQIGGNDEKTVDWALLIIVEQRLYRNRINILSRPDAVGGGLQARASTTCMTQGLVIRSHRL
jgi:hypothetical protein